MPRAKKRSDGRYRAQIYLGRDDAGKKQYKNIYAKTPAELKEKETAVRLQIGRGLDVLSQRDSFAQWADDWLRVKSAAEITDKQKANYERGVKAWKEALAGFEIGQIRADDIERSLVEMQENGYAARTVNFYRSTIRQIMQRFSPYRLENLLRT